MITESRHDEITVRDRAVLTRESGCDESSEAPPAADVRTACTALLRGRDLEHSPEG